MEEYLLQQFPLAIRDLNQHHRVHAKSVVVFGRDVIRSADPDIARGLFNRIPKLFIVRAGLFHGVGDDVYRIPGIAGVGIDGKLPVIVEDVRI